MRRMDGAERRRFMESAYPRGRSPIHRALVRLGIGERVMTFATERHWHRLVEMMAPTSAAEP